nr:hypothetical protein [Kibdelosporangium sp. MJ126-NF4]CTQ96292.1 hypothetical protein [Kibdelosporangium sp. MJ126-NF4]
MVRHEQLEQQPQPGPLHEPQHPHVPCIAPPSGTAPSIHGSHEVFMHVPLRE